MSTVIAVDRKEEKLQLAATLGADYMINVSTNHQNIRNEIIKITKGRGFDVVFDCVGAEDTIEYFPQIISKDGSLVIVGLFGNQIKMPLVRTVIQEN